MKLGKFSSLQCTVRCVQRFFFGSGRGRSSPPSIKLTRLSDYMLMLNRGMKTIAWVGGFILLESFVGLSAQAVTYWLPSETQSIYPDKSWLPDPYKKYYSDSSLPDTIKLFTQKSLDRDKISYTDVDVTFDSSKKEYKVTIETTDPSASGYAVFHVGFAKNYLAALKGVNLCKSEEGCWNKGNTNEQEPWAFFPQFGLPMVNQKAVLMLNYPPATALTEKDYLSTFTMARWTRVLETVGITDPVLYETIVDVRPIAAPGTNTTEYLPDAIKYFDDYKNKGNPSVGGGFYITPQLHKMLNPPSNKSTSRTRPLIVLGGPARRAWSSITGLSDRVLSNGVEKLPNIGAIRATPYILGQHPDVTTYQCCPKNKDEKLCWNEKENTWSNNLIEDEETDLKVACWAQQMADDSSQDTKQVLDMCHSRWVTNRSNSMDDSLNFCILAKMDSQECFGKAVTEESAKNYCLNNNYDPCADFSCPTASMP